MAGGTKSAYTALRHLGSYLQGTQDAGVLLTQLKRFGVTSDHWGFPEWSNREDRKNYNLEVFTDANWAGCKVSRKSTTSYMVFLNGSLLVSSCKLQSSIALSSAESELYASCSGIAEMLHVGSRLKFLVGANEVQMTAFSDSSAARGIMQRAGQGKLKHIHIRNLWIQDLVREKIVRLLRVPTAINPADLNTKKLAQERRKKLMSLIPMGNQNGVEIETIETIPREVTQKTIQKILRVILAGSTCFLQGCTNLTLQSGEMTVNDIIAIRNLVILALTLVILFLTNALRVQRHRLQFTEELYRELSRRLRDYRDSSSSSTSTSQESGPFVSGLTEGRPRRTRQRMTPGEATRLGIRPPRAPGLLAELGEQFVDLQGIWANVNPMRYEGGLAQIFPLPFRGTYEATIQEQQQREEAVPEEPEEPSPEDTLMQPGTGTRFDVFTQTGQSQGEGHGDTEEGDGGPRRRVHHEASHGAANPDGEEDQLHHEEDRPHPGEEVRRVQRRLPDSPDLGQGRHGHGGEDHDSGPEELTWSSSEQADHDWEQEGDRMAEREQARRNHMVDIENTHWQMLEYSSQRLGHILADGSEETNNEELERIVPSRPEVFSWYREQLLLIGEGVETHLTLAARELSHFINTILDEAMNRRGRVLNGDMMGRLFTLRNEMTAAIEDCQTPEGYRRSILFAKRLQRLEREAIQRGADAAAAEHPDEEEAEAARQEFIRQHTSGGGRELGKQDDNNALLRYLPPEADAIDNDVTMEYVDVDDINVIEIDDARGSDARQADREQQAVIHLSDGEEEQEDPRDENQVESTTRRRRTERNEAS